MKTVAIIDPDTEWSDRLRGIVDGSGRYQCISSHRDFAQAKAGLLSEQPKIVIFETCFPRGSGIEWIRWLKRKMARSEFLALANECEKKSVENALTAGATGFLCKPSDSEELIVALDDLCAGGSPFCAEAARILLQAINGDRRDANTLQTPLTRRESEILGEIIKGRLLKEITEVLRISQGTLNTHMRTLYRKLGVNSRHEITARHASGEL